MAVLESLRTFRTHTWNVVRRALLDSVKFLGWNPQTLGNAVVLALVALTYRVGRKGWTKVISGWDGWLQDFVIPFLTAAGLILLWNLIHAPNRLKIEALEKEIEALKNESPEGRWGSGVQRADFKAWAGEAALPLAYAACLLVGVRPEKPPLRNQRAQAVLFALEQAMKRGSLPPANWELQELPSVLLGLNQSMILRGANLDMRLVSKVELGRYYRRAGLPMPEFLRNVETPAIEPAAERASQ